MKDMRLSVLGVLLVVYLLFIQVNIYARKLHKHHVHKKHHHLKTRKANSVLKRFMMEQKKAKHNGDDDDDDEYEGEYNITKTYDVINNYRKKKTKQNVGSKRQLLKHSHHGMSIMQYTGENPVMDDQPILTTDPAQPPLSNNMFISTEPLGTPVAHVQGLQPNFDATLSQLPSPIGSDLTQLPSPIGSDLSQFQTPIEANTLSLIHHENDTADNDDVEEIPVGPLQRVGDGGFIMGTPEDNSQQHETFGIHHHTYDHHHVNTHAHHINYHPPPKHVYEHGVEKTEEGMDHGGFLTHEPLHVRVHGSRHIHKRPIHVADPHSETSFETHIEQGKIHTHECQNGGLFISLRQLGYQCICPKTHFGKNCQLRDYCHPCPCRNEGVCYNVRDPPHYKCTCKRGYYGDLCDKKDPCFPNPCLNHGVCTHDGSIATCICTERFRGKRCDSLNNCAPNPCKNAGKCIEEKGDGKFRCECMTMWRGTTCEEHSFCYINPCMNGGTCHEGGNSFQCACPNGFSGQTCLDRVCQPNPCMNGGTCIEDGEKFKCVCLPWTSGNLCEENRPCLTKPCMHDGKCIDAFSGFHWSFGPLQYYCICKPPYKGMNCEQHACKNCHKDAHCQIDHCVCDDGFEGNGEKCSKIESACHPNPCLNNGVCTEEPGLSTVSDSGITSGFKCSCPSPFLQPLCKEKNPCEPDPCMNGECAVRGDGTAKCTCEFGFKGATCSEKDACAPSPCQHKAPCKSLNGTAVCECIGRWRPPLCKECGCPQANIKGTPNLACNLEGECVCPSGYKVDSRNGHCELLAVPKPNADPCSNRPCVNGGECVTIGDSDFKCHCLSGTTGKVCQYKKICNPGPCLNGGTCTENEGKFMGCQCPPRFVLPFCDKEENHGAPGTCTPNPCKNEGVCLVNGKSYDCVCVARFTGPHCDVDRCKDCHRNAKCINGHCKCNLGYIGNGYNCERETCEVTCVQWSTCIDGQCMCNPGYTKVHETNPTVTQQCVPVMRGDYQGDDDDDDAGVSVVTNTRKPTPRPMVTPVIKPVPPTTVKTTTVGHVTTTKFHTEASLKTSPRPKTTIQGAPATQVTVTTGNPTPTGPPATNYGDND